MKKKIDNIIIIIIIIININIIIVIVIIIIIIIIITCKKSKIAGFNSNPLGLSKSWDIITKD